MNFKSTGNNLENGWKLNGDYHILWMYLVWSLTDLCIVTKCVFLISSSGGSGEKSETEAEEGAEAVLEGHPVATATTTRWQHPSQCRQERLRGQEPHRPRKPWRSRTKSQCHFHSIPSSQILFCWLWWNLKGKQPSQIKTQHKSS